MSDVKHVDANPLTEARLRLALGLALTAQEVNDTDARTWLLESCERLLEGTMKMEVDTDAKEDEALDLWMYDNDPEAYDLLKDPNAPRPEPGDNNNAPFRHPTHPWDIRDPGR